MASYGRGTESTIYDVAQNFNVGFEDRSALPPILRLRGHFNQNSSERLAKDFRQSILGDPGAVRWARRSLKSAPFVALILPDL